MMKSANFGIYVVSCYYAVTFGKFPSSLATKIPIIKVEEVVTLSHFSANFIAQLRTWVWPLCLDDVTTSGIKGTCLRNLKRQ